MYYALKVWSDITPLNFHEVAGNKADIQIDFTKADHNDGYPFDGPGGTVAHAFFPGERFTAGDTHFDDDEAWTFRSPGKAVCKLESRLMRSRSSWGKVFQRRVFNLILPLIQVRKEIKNRFLVCRKHK